MQPDSLDSLIQDVRALLSKRASAGRGDLAGQLRRADRLLSREARRAGQVLVEAEMLGGNAKTFHRIDEPAVRRAHRRLVAHLRSLDPWDRRKGQLLGFLGAIAGGVLLLVGLGVVVLRWRGFV